MILRCLGAILWYWLWSNLSSRCCISASERTVLKINSHIGVRGASHNYQEILSTSPPANYISHPTIISHSYMTGTHTHTSLSPYHPKYLCSFVRGGMKSLPPFLDVFRLSELRFMENSATRTKCLIVASSFCKVNQIRVHNQGNTLEGGNNKKQKGMLCHPLP